jgi:hypothetical protein
MARVSDQPQRWSQATVYPDMWVNPDEDPRDNTGVSPDGESATLQDAELLVHRIEEYARHCGHADLLRECIDGRVGQ